MEFESFAAKPTSGGAWFRIPSRAPPRSRHVLWATTVIENCEPNFRKGWKAEIQTETLGGKDEGKGGGSGGPACRRYLALNMVSAAQGYTEREALAAVAARSQVMFERAEALAVALARDLERCVPLGMRRTDHPICHLWPDPGWP